MPYAHRKGNLQIARHPQPPHNPTKSANTQPAQNHRQNQFGADTRTSSRTEHRTRQAKIQYLGTEYVPTGH